VLYVKRRHVSALFHRLQGPIHLVARQWRLVLDLAARAPWEWCTGTETCRSFMCNTYLYVIRVCLVAVINCICKIFDTKELTTLLSVRFGVRFLGDMYGFQNFPFFIYFTYFVCAFLLTNTSARPMTVVYFMSVEWRIVYIIHVPIHTRLILTF
jgi:hypothetical protein